MFRVEAGEEAEPPPEGQAAEAQPGPAHEPHPEDEPPAEEVPRGPSPPEVHQGEGGEEGQGEAGPAEPGLQPGPHPGPQASPQRLPQEGKEGEGHQVGEEEVAEEPLEGAAPVDEVGQGEEAQGVR